LNIHFKEFFIELADCSCCPRNCHVDRTKINSGFCKSDASFKIGSICNHHGEEPIISGKNGICNVFFSHCNLQCVYCQNIQISKNVQTEVEYKLSFNEIISQICHWLDKGCETVGFVSPSHCIPHIKLIIHTLNEKNYYPTFVYNSNGYDKVESLKSLEGLIDVYLPDFKYYNSKTAKQFSDANNYPDIAKDALLEMYRQKGSSIIKNNDGVAVMGLIIRHLVLPEHTSESIQILNWIANNLSTKVHISLMSQYYPTEKVQNHPILGKRVEREEYDSVVEAMDKLGFTNGWIQEMQSADNYQPNFLKAHPFEYL